MRRPVATPVLAAGAIALLAAGCSGQEQSRTAIGEGTPAGSESAGAGDLTARLVDPAGTQVGTVTLADAEGGLRVSVAVTGLPPGFHGLHLHAVGRCEPDSPSPADPAMRGNFLSAGAHVGAGEAEHGEHAGDLPLLYVTGSGTGSLTTVTDALTRAELTDDDGSAVVVHAEPDNYAHVPERYAPGGPDPMTRNTGDAGARIACGPVGR